MEEVTAKTPEEPATAARIHPLMSSKERLALWRSVRARWKHRAADLIPELDQMRQEWERALPTPRT